jgi:hypothetical protein
VKLAHLVGFIMRIHHDARSSEYHIRSMLYKVFKTVHNKVYIDQNVADSNTEYSFVNKLNFFYFHVNTVHVCCLLFICTNKFIYRRTPVSAGNTFQDLPRLRKTADNTEHYI